MNLTEDKVMTTVASTLQSAKLFYRARWAQVKVGDVILVPGDDEPIAEVTVKEIHPVTRDGGELVIVVYYNFGYATYGVTFDPNGHAYVQSRF